MKKNLKYILIFLGILFLSSLALLDYYLHDFHTVVPNQIYRSPQLSAQQFAAIIKQDGIKTIINLRGANPGNQWYTDELSVSKLFHVQHYDIPLQSEQLPTAAQFKKLVNILETAPRPILLHCESGVDRSGFAATVSLILMNAPLKTAEQQESLEYFVLLHDSLGKQFLRAYKKWLAENQLTTSKQNFLRWLAQYR